MRNNVNPIDAVVIQQRLCDLGQSVSVRIQNHNVQRACGVQRAFVLQVGNHLVQIADGTVDEHELQRLFCNR